MSMLFVGVFSSEEDVVGTTMKYAIDMTNNR